jgi:hypothetical protein
MQADIREYLTATVTPELLTVIEEALDMFERVGLNDCDSQLQEILLSASAMDMHEPNDAIIDLINSSQVFILKQHSIVLNDGAPITVRTQIINGLLDLEDYESPEMVVLAARIDGDPVERLAEVLSLTTLFTADELAPYFEDVSVSLLNLIIDQATLKINVQLDEEPAASFDDKPAAKYFLDLGAPDLIIMRYIRDGMHIGYPLKVYLDQFGHELEDLPVQSIAQNLIMTCLVSSDAKDTIKASIDLCIDMYITDINVITRVGQEINTQLARMVNHEKV